MCLPSPTLENNERCGYAGFARTTVRLAPFPARQTLGSVLHRTPSSLVALLRLRLSCNKQIPAADFFDMRPTRIEPPDVRVISVCEHPCVLSRAKEIGEPLVVLAGELAAIIGQISPIGRVAE